MRVYNSIILSGLLLAGFASNLKSFENRSAQNLQEFNAQQHLVADAEGATGLPHRGSGRFSTEPNPNLALIAPESLTKDDDKQNTDKQPSRGSGRFTTEPDNNIDLALQQLLAKNDDKESGTAPSRGSGRLMEAYFTNA